MSQGSSFSMSLPTFVPHPFFFVRAIVVGVKQYLIAILMCVSLMTGDTEHSSRRLLPLIYLWRNINSRLLPIFNWVFVFLLLSYILWILNPCQIHDLQMFSSMVRAVFQFFDSIFWYAKVLILIASSLFFISIYLPINGRFYDSSFSIINNTIMNIFVSFS